MAFTPLERKAAFASACILKGMTRLDAASSLGVSWNHVKHVLGGDRRGSPDLMIRIAEFTGVSFQKMWGKPKPDLIAKAS